MYRFPFNNTVLRNAAWSGDLATFEYCFSQTSGEVTAEVCLEAAKASSPDVLTWLVENGHCELKEELCTAAAQGGQLLTLQYLREAADCPWDPLGLATGLVDSSWRAYSNSSSWCNKLFR